MTRTLRRAIAAPLLLGTGVTLLALVLLLTAPTNAGPTLEARIQSATGITRVLDAGLQARAAKRAIEIQANFTHCCLSYGEAEVIAWNSGFSDPVGQFVIGWLNSPTHAAVLLDPGYVDIGCATAVSGARTYGVCLFRYRAAPIQPDPSPRTTPDPQPGTIPDTAMKPLTLEDQ